MPGNGALRNTLLDPAVNLLLQRLRQELSETRTRLDDTQNELSAWKFTPDRYVNDKLIFMKSLIRIILNDTVTVYKSS